ncbi:hypothetical protein CXG81DRAFT_24322 [Caulochytrium protostelioides]|uniref:RraA-like protein n=1 Tax=Caulochytrium protostelioides TaxID=1555241 RepID=A0A4P9XCY8_9FUNG|nr:hypothetical protein CXG81DRAFT_24322 [Caulochytrium protostelioides]|eukprot:RKP03011.1 hypothetical protein CXG81DRAFT_24322 [Caulochytrium protostelioides]
MASAPLTDAQRQALARYASTDLCDALADLGLHGFVADLPWHSPPHAATPLIGPAWPVMLAPARRAASPSPAAAPATPPPPHYLDAAPAGCVVVLRSPPGPHGVWGGLLTERAAQRGVRGAVVWGRVRDLDEVRARGFPLAATGTSAMGAKGWAGAGTPAADGVVLGDADDADAAAVTVRPGDVVVGDAHGVVVLPRDRIDAVLARCAVNTAADAKVMADLQQGVSLTEAFRRHRGA